MNNINDEAAIHTKCSITTLADRIIKKRIKNKVNINVATIVAVKVYENIYERITHIIERNMRS